MGRTTSLSSPRHLLMTLLVALATGAAGVSVNAATSDEVVSGSNDPWAGEFATPGPHVGDRGRYVHSGGHSQRDDGYWPDEVTFEWRADTEAYDQSAARVLANQLLLHWGDRDPELLLLQPGSNVELGGGRSESSSDSQPASLFFPAQTTNETMRYSWFHEGRSATLWCGIKTPLQGRAIDLTQRQTDPTDCWNGPHSWASDDYSIVVRSVGGVAPLRTIVVDSYDTEDLGRPFGGARPFMRSTHIEGLPYATRVEFMSGDTGPGPDGYSASYDLAGFALGLEPIAMEPQVLAPAPPPLALALRSEAGPDLAGFEHPYPVAVAWDKAKQDLGFREFQDYLADHPDAYVGLAEGITTVNDGQTSYEWYVVATDGTAQFAFRNVHTPGPAQPPVAAPLPITLTHAAGGNSYDRLTNGWEDGSYPKPADAPPQLPTVASLVEAWKAITGRDDANAYGFDLRCTYVAIAPCGSMALVTAGTSTDTRTGNPGVGGSQRDIEHTRVQAGADGRLASYSERWTTQEYDSLAPGDVPDSGGPAPEPAELTALQAGFDWVPTPKEAAAVGGIALLATFAYWLSPLLKGGGLGGVGLFSRVERGRLLDSPLRQQLVQAVEARPGIHHNALVRELGRGNGAAEHHLAKLVDGGLLLRLNGPGYTCYFPPGTDRRTMAATPSTKADGARRILDALAGGATGVRQVAAATGLAPSTVSHHLGRLRAAGLVAGDGLVGYRAVGGATAGAVGAA